MKHLNFIGWFIDQIIMGGLFMMYANHKGSEGLVHVGTSAIAELRGWEYNESAAAIDDTILTDTWETRQTGNKHWTGSATAWWDETDTNGQEVLTIGAGVTLKFYMEGTGTGATYKTGSAIVTGIRQSAAINGIVEKNFTFEGAGALTQTTV
jgi:hypothetical protein